MSDHDRTRIQAAIKKSHIDPIKFADPDCVIFSDNGKGLSGGERQRIGLARAFFQSSEITILDEATSAIDKETEYSVLSNISELQTVIFVTHNPDLLKFCNIITGFILPGLATRVLLTLHDVSFLKSADVIPFPRHNLRQAIGRIYRKALVPFYAKRATKVCTVSEFAVLDILHELGITSEFIYHGFELLVAEGSDLLQEEAVCGKLGKPGYLAITGADPQKNLTLVVSAFITLYRKYKRDAPKLNIIGVTQEQYERLSPDVVLTENISFLGMRPHREIPGHISRCKALVIPSYYESFGLCLS